MTEDFIELEKDKISDGKDMQIESNVNMKKKKKTFHITMKIKNTKDKKKKMLSS